MAFGQPGSRHRVQSGSSDHGGASSQTPHSQWNEWQKMDAEVIPNLPEYSDIFL